MVTLPRFHNPIPKSVTARQNTASAAAEYRGLFRPGAESKRREKYMTMVNHYYDLVTDIYEYGWGESFHFAPRNKGESFDASIRRHERFLAEQLDLQPGQEVLDVGCGVGGPMREIARVSGANITGVNNNAYQLEKLAAYNERDGLQKRCRGVQADFLAMPFDDDTFDAAYTIEATCHAPDRTAVFSEIFRVLRPGARFAGFEWCMTDAWDPEDPHHEKVRAGIEEGDALPPLPHYRVIVDALEDAGFEVETHRDLAETSDPATPWYLPLTGKELSLSSFPRTPVGQLFTHTLLRVGELLRVAPEGSGEITRFLIRGARNLAEGGRLGIFTPMYFFVARKPPAAAG